MNHLKQIVEEELRRGLEAASQLRSLLVQPQASNDHERSKSSNERILTENYSTIITNSFDTSIAIIQKMVQTMEMKAPSSSVGKTTNACPTKNRSRTIETSDLTPDGYTWRKYGKKSISNSKYPKEYYRCAYKESQNCEAIKHVQRISDKPTKYKITYYAQHACQPLPKNNNNNLPSINILNSNEEYCTNFTISGFESTNPTSLNTQVLNHVALNPSSTSLSTTYHPAPVALPSTTIVEPTLAEDVAMFNYPEQLYSQTMFSPNYNMTSSIAETVEDYSLMMMANNSFDMGGDAFLHDLPLWE